jgi:two-component system LytT family response regulator
MKLRTVIVDDEPLGRDLLRVLLSTRKEIEIIAECRNGREAIDSLRSKQVDLLFLDIQMPDLSGFDVVETIGVQHLPPTVFVTAYHEHAVRAFDVHAIDYLTKPVEIERLQRALDRVEEKIAAKEALLTQAKLNEVLLGLRGAASLQQPYLTRILVKDGAKDVLLAVESIEWIEAAEYYCCLHAEGRRFMLRQTIGDLSSRLDPGQFVRIHRSSIVHLDQIKEIYHEGQEENSIVLRNGQRLKMSKAGRQRLLEVGRAS